MKILIIDEMHPSLLPMLESKGWEYDYLPKISKEEIVEIISGYEGLILRSKLSIDKIVLKNASKLRFIARSGAGFEHIDSEEVEKRNIELIIAPEGNRDAVGEHAIGMLLSLFNHINRTDREVRQKIWKREANRGVELKGKTVGIIGYGNMGKAFAKRLNSFDCQVIAYDKYLENYSDELAKQATMDELFEKTDILSLHTPLTAETRKLANLDFLNKFKKNIYVVNTARGEIIPLKDLKTAIESGKVLGACLDVLENEKFQTLSPDQDEILQALFQFENILFSPHIAGWTHESYIRLNEVLVEKIDKYLSNSGW